MPNLTPDYTWDQRLNNGLGAYRNTATGRVVPRAEIIRALDNTAEAARANIRAVSDQLINREITLAEWQAQMAQQVKIVHTYNAAAAKGGWAQMSQSDWGHVGYQVKSQLKYLRDFAKEIESGKQPLNGRVRARADQYGKSGHATHESILKREAVKTGKVEERRVLAAAENCRGCIDESQKNWQPIGTLDPIGSKECRQNCRCRFDYR